MGGYSHHVQHQFQRSEEVPEQNQQQNAAGEVPAGLSGMLGGVA